MFLITSCQKSTGTDKETDRRQKEEEERGRRREKKSQPLSILHYRLKCFTCARVCPLPPGRWFWSLAVPLHLCFPEPLPAPAAELQPPSLLPLALPGKSSLHSPTCPSQIPALEQTATAFTLSYLFAPRFPLLFISSSPRDIDAGWSFPLKQPLL